MLPLNIYVKLGLMCFYFLFFNEKLISGSTLDVTAWSKKIKVFINPKLTDTAWDPAPRCMTERGVRLRAVSYSAEFCRHTISLYRPLFAFKGNASQILIHRSDIQTKATILYQHFIRLAY